VRERRSRWPSHATLYRNPNDPFEAWDEHGLPVLPMTIPNDSPSNGITPGPFGNTDPGTGRSLMSSLATSLNWATGMAEHPQVPLRVGNAAILVDRDMADLIDLLNRAGIASVTSCSGSEREWAYVMLVGLDSIKRFAQVWQAVLVPLGHAIPTLDLDARNAGWRHEIGEAYPFPKPVPVDSFGLTYTAVWKEHDYDMARIAPVVVAALRSRQRASEAAASTSAAS
jgi:hypothetical protein